ncbi:response regulator [Oleidesulfovibrio sp.]|uniref:response regulator n=1 Tax=Oleidesulfovibrio sp. TaxID=2909707 RepID=UPI003A846DD6
MKPFHLGSHAPRGTIAALQLIVVMLLIGLLFSIFSQKETHLSLARVALQSQASILGERLSATLSGIDLVLLNTQSSASALLQNIKISADPPLPTALPLRLRLPTPSLLHSSVSDILLFDASGQTIASYSGKKLLQQTDLKELFRRHRDSWHEFSLLLQPTSPDSTYNSPQIFISRRVVDDSGMFIGILSAIITPEALYDPYLDGALLNIDTVLLVDHQYRIIASWPAQSSPYTGLHIEEVEGLRGIEKSLIGGGLVNSETRDFFVSSYQMSQLPLHIITMRSKTVTQRPWQASLHRYLMFATALFMITAALAITGIRQHRKRRDAEQALQRSEQLYRSIAESYPNGVLIIFDGQGVIQKADGQLLGHMGLQKSDIEGKTAQDALPPAAGRNLAAHHSAALKGHPVHFTLMLRGKIYMGHSLPFSCETHVSGGMTVLEDITELQQTQARLRESQNLLREAQRLAKIGHFDRQFVTGNIYWSPELLTMAGLPHDFDVTSAPGLLAQIAPAIPPIFEAMINSSNHESISYKEAGIPYRTVDGEHGYGLLRAKLLRDASGNPLRLTGTFQDITEEHNTRMALLQSENRYRALSGNLPNAAVCLFDSELRLLIADGKQVEVLGLSRETPAGSYIPQLMPQALAIILEPLCKQAIAGQRTQMEVVHGNKVLEVTVVPVPAHIGGNDGLVVALDITKRKATEAALKDALHAAERAARLKSQFVANISHELRTPISGIMGITDVMLTRTQEEKNKEHLEMIRNVAESLRLVVNDILDFSRLEAGKMPLNATSFNLKKTIEQAIGPLRIQAQQKRLQLTVSLEAELPDLVLGDSGRLGQILTNLVGNAVKFTDSGYVKINVARSEGDFINFVVQDTGPGIPSEKQHLLFHSFVQIDGTLSRQHQGSGLGLAISRSLALLMGGNLVFEPSVTTGSRFILTVPLPEEDQTDDAPCAHTQTHVAGSDAEPVGTFNLEAVSPYTSKQPPVVFSQQVATAGHILLVEDNPLNQEFLTLFLLERRYSVTTASSGYEALDVLEKETFDAILMDVQMPGMNGLETTMKIRTSGAVWADIPVIALTANTMPGDKERYLSQGLDGYVQKPVNKNQLFSELTRCIVNKQQQD